MKSIEELNGTPVEHKDGKIVIPDGYKILPQGIEIEGLAADPTCGNDRWDFLSDWYNSEGNLIIIAPDPDYTPTKKEEDVVLNTFNAVIKDLEEELQDVLTAKELYLRLCKDAETFAAIADKYSWLEKVEE